MKATKLAIVFYLTILLHSCSKDESLPITEDYGSINDVSMVNAGVIKAHVFTIMYG